MTGEPATVIIVDDDNAVRDSLKSLVRSMGLQVVIHGSVQDFLETKLPEGPSCLVLDIRLPGQSGLDLQDTLSKSDIRLPIIFISGHGDIPMSVRAMKAGAVGFLEKPVRDQELLDAIHTAIDLDRQRIQDESDVADIRKRYETLTPREQEVLARVIAGRLNKQIAAELGVSEITVKVHRGQAMRKMGTRSLADLVRMAGKLKLPATASDPVSHTKV
jgi:FixJ family two-component response regulator